MDSRLCTFITVSTLSEPRHFQQRLVLDMLFTKGTPLSGTCEEGEGVKVTELRERHQVPIRR